MELNYLYGAKITAAIKKGSAMHAELEGETNIQVDLTPKAFADVMYKILYTSYLALEVLFRNKKAREIQIYGMINGYPLVGKMDMLEIRDGETFVWEDKTKTSDKPPSDEQLTSHKAQVIFYKRLLDDIKAGTYTLEKFRKAQRTAFLSITPEFVRQLDAMKVDKKLQTVDAIAERYFENLMKLPKISDTIHIKYINQLTGKEIKLYKFTYSEKEMQDTMDYILKFWKGERESMPVPEGEKWKCNFCVFFGDKCKVWWPQKKLAAE